jgi:D-serine deaminase-like pyridoxal phosphate-dependent protein
MSRYASLARATEHLEPPYAVVDLDALDANAREMARRAAGTPIRLASKSVRCRSIQRRVLGTTGFRGVLAFTLPEALWLAGGEDAVADVLVGYPTVDRIALHTLAHDEQLARRVTVLVDSPEHLSFVAAAVGEAALPVRVCLDLDASLHLLGDRVHVGPRRSPVRSAADAAAMVRAVEAFPGLTLVGLMAYEGQIAGVGDRPPGRRLRGVAIRFMQRRSAAELAERRGAIVAALGEFVELEIVNGGGTGSLELTGAEEAVTEVTAGSGFYAPALFDHYGRFSLTPAAGFALPIVRKPAEKIATALGGGYLASGAGDAGRLPAPWLPPGLEFDPDEGAGEVQTPLCGDAAADLKAGDRAYLRHAKAGELCEHFNALHLVEGEEIVDVVPTYRGDGQAFL